MLEHLVGRAGDVPVGLVDVDGAGVDRGHGRTLRLAAMMRRLKS
jgi:hypothetical protein